MSNAQQTLIKLANELAKFVDDNEKISLPFFTVKLTKAQRDFPEDHTIGMISLVANRMANNDKLFISRAEIKDLYEKFYSRSTKFASVFVDELGVVEVLEPIHNITKENTVNDFMQESIDKIVDPVLASSLDQAFGGNKVKSYNAALAKQAISICNNTLLSIGFHTKSEVICGNNDILVCAVAFETPRGTTSILVPVEIVNDSICYPSIFVANAGTENINKQSIYNYLTTQAGNKLMVRASEVLDAAMMATGSNKEISNVDLALTKLNSTKENKEYYLGNQIIGIKVASENPNLMINLPKIEDPKFETIAKTFDTELGFASFKFGTKLITQGNLLIIKQLQACNITNYNIAVLASNDDIITYSISINGGSVAFKVPVKIENNMAIPPSVLICDGSVKSFDKSELVKLLNSGGFDRAASVSASALYGIKASELVNIVKNAIAEENYVKAEDALNVLANSDDDKAYNIALVAFSQGLKKREDNIEEVSKCAMIIKNNHSQYDICGHTGLPLHKIYIDKFGHCQPLYRKNMADSYEGASFMHSKVYL